MPLILNNCCLHSVYRYNAFRIMGPFLVVGPVAGAKSATGVNPALNDSHFRV